MKNFNFTFTDPWYLLLILPLVIITVVPYLRVAKKRRRHPKYILPLCFRILALLAIIFMMAGLSKVTVSNDTSVIIMVDLSDSTIPVRSDMEKFISDYVANADEDIKIGIVAFADESVYEIPMTTDLKFDGLDFKSLPASAASNIEMAIKYAQTLISTDENNQLIILTDGNQTEGDAQNAALQIENQNVRIDAVAFDASVVDTPEVQINDIEMPSNAAAGETYEITVSIESSLSTSAELLLCNGSKAVSKTAVTINKGQNTYTLHDSSNTTGINSYHVEVLVNNDTVSQNNIMYSYIKITGKSNILIIDGTGSESAKLKSLIKDSYTVTVATPQKAPASLSELRNYDEVILMNVANSDLPVGFDALLEEYVSKLGRGVLTTGGTNTYYYGDMIDTDFEKFLPVDINLDDAAESSTTALMILIDQSSSMTGTPISMAIQGAVNSINALGDDDYVGVVAFATNVNVVSKLSSMKNKDKIIAAVQKLGTIRGTNLTDAVTEAYDELQAADADTKHVIILSDGNPQDSGYAKIVQKMNASGITTSTILIGTEASSNIMSQLATLGGGRFYQVDNISDLPDVMKEETDASQVSYSNTGTFNLSICNYSQVLSDVTTFPSIKGYISTAIKSSASNVLYTDENMPVYAEWDYGLGRVASFTTDLNGTWSSELFATQDGMTLIKNVVASILPSDHASSGLAITTSSVGTESTIKVATSDTSGSKTLEATIIAPDGTSVTQALTVSKPGIYTGDFETSKVGLYTIMVQQLDETGSIYDYAETALAVSYSPEYDTFLAPNETLLESMCELGGGEVMTSVSDLLGILFVAVKSNKSLFIPFGILALLMLTADLVIRNTKWKIWQNFAQKIMLFTKKIK